MSSSSAFLICAMFKRFWWVFLATAAAGAMVGLLSAAVVAYVTPRKYESEAVIEVKPDFTEISTIQNEPVDVSSDDETPEFLRTAAQVIKSSNSLAKVVENLDLVKRWGVDKETAIGILKEIVDTQNIRDTDLISIRVRHTNRQDARVIAAEVAMSYRGYRMEIQKWQLDQQLSALDKAIKEQEDNVEIGVKTLRTIPVPDPVDPHTTIRRGGGPDYFYAKSNLETDQALLQSMRLKQASATTLNQLQNETVIIHEEPQIAQFPVSPNVRLILLLGTAGGILLSPLLALLLITMKNGPCQSI